MNKTLILTGWSKTVYMTAAAAAQEALMRFEGDCRNALKVVSLKK